MRTEIYPGNDFIPLPVFRERQIEKLYWSNGDLQEMLCISESTVRYYAKVLGLSLKRTTQNYRMFTKWQVDLMKEYVHLVKQEGYTVHGAAKKLKKLHIK